MRYGLEPNFSKGKTEAIVALRGKGSVGARRYWFTEQHGQLHLPDCDAPDTYIRMVAKYRHLGGQVDARAKSKSEVQARTGQVRQVFKRYKKSLFTAQGICKEKRAKLLRPFVLSVLEYNLGTLVSLTAADKQNVATTLLSIYKAVWRDSTTGTDDNKIAWPRLCYALQLPSPEAIIQIARLRYFGQIYRHGGTSLWALISTQQGWLRECEEAFDWLHHQNLWEYHSPAPQGWLVSMEQAFVGPPQTVSQDCYNEHGNMRWSRATTRRSSMKDTTTLRRRWRLRISSFPEEIATQVVEQTEHICLACQRVFGSRTGWASHAFKCHQRTKKARQYAGGTHCAACNTEYWEYKRLLNHLCYSGRCRRALACARMEVPQEPGLGSRHQKRQREELLQPCSVVPGVSFRDLWAGVEMAWDEPLLDELFHTIPLDDTQVPLHVDDLLEELRRVLVKSTVEFKVVRATIECWKDSMLDVAQQSGNERRGLIRAFFITLAQLDLVQWLVPTYNRCLPSKVKQWKSILDEELSSYNGWPKEHLQPEWFQDHVRHPLFQWPKEAERPPKLLGTVGLPGWHQSGNPQRRYHLWWRRRLCAETGAAAVVGMDGRRLRTSLFRRDLPVRRTA